MTVPTWERGIIAPFQRCRPSLFPPVGVRWAVDNQYLIKVHNGSSNMTSGAVSCIAIEMWLAERIRETRRPKIDCRLGFPCPARTSHSSGVKAPCCASHSPRREFPKVPHSWYLAAKLVCMQPSSAKITSHQGWSSPTASMCVEKTLVTGSFDAGSEFDRGCPPVNLSCLALLT